MSRRTTVRLLRKDTVVWLDDGTHKQVFFDVFLNWEDVDKMARKAYRSALKKAKDGPLVVKLVAQVVGTP